MNGVLGVLAVLNALGWCWVICRIRSLSRARWDAMLGNVGLAVECEGLRAERDALLRERRADGAMHQWVRSVAGE